MAMTPSLNRIWETAKQNIAQMGANAMAPTSVNMWNQGQTAPAPQTPAGTAMSRANNIPVGNTAVPAAGTPPSIGSGGSVSATDYASRLMPGIQGAASDMLTGRALQPFQTAQNEASIRSAQNQRAGAAQATQALGLGMQGAGYQQSQGLEAGLAAQNSENLLNQEQQRQNLAQQGIAAGMQIGNYDIAKTQSDSALASANQNRALQQMDTLIKLGGSNIDAVPDVLANIGITGVDMSNVKDQSQATIMGDAVKNALAIGATTGFDVNNPAYADAVGAIYDSNPGAFPGMSRDQVIQEQGKRMGLRANDMTAIFAGIDDMVASGAITPEQATAMKATAQEGIGATSYRIIDGKLTPVDANGVSPTSVIANTATTLTQRFAGGLDPVVVTDDMVKQYAMQKGWDGTSDIKTYLPAENMSSAEMKQWMNNNYADPSVVELFLNNDHGAPQWAEMTPGERSAITGDAKVFAGTEIPEEVLQTGRLFNSDEARAWWRERAKSSDMVVIDNQAYTVVNSSRFTVDNKDTREFVELRDRDGTPMYYYVKDGNVYPASAVTLTGVS